MEQFELGLYDSDTVLSNIVYDTFSLDTTVEDQPLQDWCPLESNPEPELETSSESEILWQHCTLLNRTTLQHLPLPCQ